MTSQEQIKQNFARRFAFGVHALLSIPAILLLLVSAYNSQQFSIIMDMKFFAGINGSMLVIQGILLALLGIHGVWFWNTQSDAAAFVKRRRFLFITHLIVAIGVALACYGIGMDYGQFIQDTSTVAGSPHLRGDLSPLFFFVPFLLLITALPHAIYFAYRELLERTLSQKPKPKIERLQNDPVISDDGELFYDEEEYQLEKRD